MIDTMNPDLFLQPTPLINSDHPDIISKASELTQDFSKLEDKARAIFYFIRDKIPYEFRAQLAEDAYHAS